MTGTKSRDFAVLPDGSTNLRCFAQIITRSKKLMSQFGTLAVRYYATQLSYLPEFNVAFRQQAKPGVKLELKLRLKDNT
jgi:hypothetical protein